MGDKEYRGRKTLFVIFFTIFMLVLGRNLTFIPKFDFSIHQSSTNEKMEKEVKEIIKNKPGSYSVYYKNLNTGEAFGIDEKQIQMAASVNKVPIIAAIYYLDSQGKLSLDDKITVLKSDIQDYGTGTLRYQKPDQSYSVRNLAKLSLKVSDNTAAHVLGVKIGTDVLQELVDSWGLSQTNMDGNTTSVADMEKLFEDIRNGKFASPAKSLEFLSFLTDSETEDRLPKVLPKTVKIYHKTGDGEGFVHDIGIIEDGENVYFLGVMTSDIGDNEKLAKDTIAQISKMIYKYHAEK